LGAFGRSDEQKMALTVIVCVGKVNKVIGYWHFF
jgi:hypothetical protein